MRLLLLAGCLIIDPVLAAQNPPLEPAAMQLLADESRERAGPAVQTEWWRLTASLADREGRPWQLEWTLYRQAPGPRAVETGAQVRSMVLAHAALGTPDGGYHDRRFSGGGPVRAAAVPAGRKGEWQWVSRGEALFPARLSFSIGDRRVNFLLESIDTPPAVDIAMDGELPAGARHGPDRPRVRVRGFVDQGADKTYLRGLGRFDRERNSLALAAEPAGKRGRLQSLAE